VSGVGEVVEAIVGAALAVSAVVAAAWIAVSAAFVASGYQWTLASSYDGVADVVAV